MITPTSTQAPLFDRLIFLGLLQFFFGLVAGLFIPMMANPRMGLSAHLEGVMNGMFLVLLGLIGNKLLLSLKWQTALFWLAVYGTFANFIAVILAAMTGFGKIMPLAGGKEGTAPVEEIISFLLITLALCMLAVCIIALLGAAKYMRRTYNKQ